MREASLPTPHANKNIERIAVFAFGVIFLCAILYLLVKIPNPTVSQFFGFRLTLALAAAGIGALLPGFLNIELTLPLQGAIRTGGALALFASVWFVNPATIGINPVPDPPAEDSDPKMAKFLSLTDAGDHAEAYKMMSSFTQKRYTLQDYVALGRNVRDPLGARVGQPEFISGSTPNKLDGVEGPFVIHQFLSRFVASNRQWIETVAMIAEAGEWRMFDYEVVPCEPSNCTYAVSSK